MSTTDLTDELIEMHTAIGTVLAKQPMLNRVQLRAAFEAHLRGTYHYVAHQVEAALESFDRGDIKLPAGLEAR